MVISAERPGKTKGEGGRTEDEHDHDSLFSSLTEERSELVVGLTDTEEDNWLRAEVSTASRTKQGKRKDEPVGKDDLKLPQVRRRRRGRSSALASLGKDCERLLDEEEDVGGLKPREEESVRVAPFSTRRVGGKLTFWSNLKRESTLAPV